MPLAVQELEKRIQEIENLADRFSQGYGRLLNWQNPGDPFWHYGIGLSNTHIFDTGMALHVFERQEAKYVLGIDGIAFEPKQSIERLKHALYVFRDWEYNVFGWNCEHLGRLIVTDIPRSYQSIPIWWSCDLTPEGDHKTARQVFRDYLEKVDPSLNR